MGLFEILIIFVVFLVLGPRRIVDLFRSMTRGVHDFVDTLGRDKEPKEIEKDHPDDRG